MFGWIARAWDWASRNIGGPVVGWVRDMFHALWGFLHTIFGHVIGAWPYVWAGLHAIWVYFDRYARAVGSLFHYLYKIWIPGIIREFLRLYHDVLNYAKAVYNWAVRMFDWVKHWVSSLIDAVRAWVINDIWNPLYKSLLNAWHWIDHEGATLWYYITHPDKLVDLLWDTLIAKLEAEAWNVGNKLGKFFLALIVHNIRQFALLIEDIINAVI